MTASSIIKELSCNKTPGRHIPLFMERWIGRRDYTFSQMNTTADGFITTAWINSRYESLSEYESLIYNKVIHATETAAHAIAEECEELELIEYEAPVVTADSESSERLAARIIERNEKNREREKQIRLHLASLKSELEMIDVALNQHIQRAESTTNKHIYAYLGGLIRAAGEDGVRDMPSKPSALHRNERGKTAYEDHFNKMMMSLNEALERGDCNEDDQQTV